MAASRQDLILSTLQELGKENFKIFKSFLRDEEFLGSHNYRPIPLVYLEDKDYVDVAERLTSHYTREGALRVMYIVLEKMGQKQLTQRLQSSSSTALHMNIL